MKLEYSVYPNSIFVTITALVDIENLNVQVVYYQDSDYGNQDIYELEIDTLKKSSGYYVPTYSLDDCEFNRVELKNISGKKRAGSEPFEECIRKGTVHFPTERLETELFELRVDKTQNHSTSFGILYITSPVDLWHIDLEIYMAFPNIVKTYIVQDIKEIVAYQEYPLELKKLLGDENPLLNVQLKSIKASKIKDLIV